MEAEIEVKFYEKLNTLIASKMVNNSSLIKEKYGMLIDQIKTLKQGNSRKIRKHYQLLNGMMLLALDKSRS